MKISQEVRDFARLNPSPIEEEADSAPAALSGVRGREQEEEVEAPAVSDVERGMAQMSERYREGGNELYVGANGREHD